MRMKPDEECTFVDTDVALSYLHGDTKAVDFVTNRKPGTTFISVVSYFEIMKGIFHIDACGKPPGKTARMEPPMLASFLSNVAIVDLDVACVDKAVMVSRGPAGTFNESSDKLIAGTVLANWCTKLVTMNIKHMDSCRPLDVESIGVEYSKKPRF